MHSTMTMKMSSLRLLSTIAILASYSNYPTTNAFLSPTTPLNCPNSIRLTSDVSSWSSCKKTFRSDSPSSSSSLLKAYEDDDEDGYEINSTNGSSTQQISSTSFGADNVPVEQRPSNEYLNLISQPLFGWASQEIGDQGLGIRLAVTYAAFFAVV